ncbi:MAG TPA: type II toxin-antitoxin system ParD family antitoxin [Isosphaeraceae bacterium]|nr:type II toxin-antitoxin system ParD family antitoxin [Isosphaeraceae bacterium]
MELAVSAELQQIVREKVESGDYASADDLLREALQLLDDRDRLRAWKLEALRQEIAVGIQQAEQGMVAPLDMDAIRTKVAERLRSQGQ